MKVINKEDFLKLKEETLFSFYQSAAFEGLFIKNNCIDSDEAYSFDEIIGAVENYSTGDFFDKCELMRKGGSVPVDFDYTDRGDVIPEDQLFAVYEKEDVVKLIDRLKRLK